MLNVYIITLALAVGIGLAATLALLAISRTARFAGFFKEARGEHERPRWGGVILLLAFALTPFIASGLSGRASELFSPKSGDFIAFLFACAFVFAVGFLDDWKQLNWRPRLLAQVAAASAVYSAGYTLDEIGLPWGPEIPLGFFAPVATVLWIVFFTNAFNLIDGRDGVATGVAILAAVTLAQVAANADHPTVALLLVAITGAALGMLPFNLPPASVYLGDSGANVLGFIIGALSIRAATGSSEAVFIAVPLVALGFPILDTVLAAVRRMLDHRSPLLGDEDHIHHRLELAGFGPRGLLMVLYAVCALFAAGAILLHFVDVFALEAMTLVGMLLMIAVILTKLGYVLSIWNSASIIWLRRRIRWLDDPVTAAFDSRDRE